MLIRGRGELYPTIVGTLMYIATVSRPEIAFPASMLARFLASPTTELVAAAEKVVKYLNKTSDFKLTFGQRRRARVDGVINRAVNLTFTPQNGALAGDN
jgi:hypothetical protein